MTTEQKTEQKSETKKPAPKAPAKAKPTKEPKAKKLAASAVEIDTTEYVKKNEKMPGTGKRDPKTVWQFRIGDKAMQLATEFFRDARAAAIKAAVEANVSKIALVA